jgi:hypothetical protein
MEADALVAISTVTLDPTFTSLEVADVVPW